MEQLGGRASSRGVQIAVWSHDIEEDRESLGPLSVSNQTSSITCSCRDALNCHEPRIMGPTGHGQKPPDLSQRSLNLFFFKFVFASCICCSNGELLNTYILPVEDIESAFVLKGMGLNMCTRK